MASIKENWRIKLKEKRLYEKTFLPKKLKGFYTDTGTFSAIKNNLIFLIKL